MHATRRLAGASLISLAGGLVLVAAGLADARAGVTSLEWFAAHGRLLVLGGVLPGLAALHAWSLRALAQTELAGHAAAGWLGGSLLAALGALVSLWPLEAAGLAMVAAAATLWSVQVMRHAPKKSLTDVERDRLTKGDDACLKHIHFAHRFLPLGAVLLLAASLVHGVWPASLWGPRVALAATHVLVIGYGLLSVYGLSHLWVPRLSGIPAIAAGAIKGELHSSLLGLVGVTAGFLVGAGTSVGRGLLVGLGPFVFLGFFVWMGVLGANIMKNKSPTHTVRPEFVYIPWTFTAVFWLVTAVLMGIFLNVLPDSLASRLPALRFAHLHVGLLGGMVQLLLGLATRLVPLAIGARPPRFGAAMKWGFYLFNTGLALAVWGRFAGSDGPWVAAGLGTLAIALVLYMLAMAPFFKPRGAAGA